MEISNFDLWIVEARKGFLARASIDGQQAESEFSSPFDGPWEDLLGRETDWLRDARPTGGKSARDTVEEVGGRLFQAVFSGKVGALWRANLSKVSDGSRRIRLSLRLRDAEGISEWPWEWLYDPEKKNFLALSVEAPIVRYQEMPVAARPLFCDLPLRILVAAANPSGSGRIDVQREWKALRGALNGLMEREQVVIDLLEEVTFSGLRRQLRKGNFHVLHFIGHGILDPSRSDGMLLFEDGKGGVDRVNGRDLAILMPESKTLSLIVLNACEGARFTGVAKSLVHEGIPAVVAMRFKVTDLSAATFSGSFYEAMAEGTPLDEAMSEARLAMFSADRDGIEWGTPVLFLRSPDSKIIEIPKSPKRPAILRRNWERLRRVLIYISLLGAGVLVIVAALKLATSQDTPLKSESPPKSSLLLTARVLPPTASTEGCPPSKLLGLQFVRIEPGKFVMESKRKWLGKKRVYEVEITQPYCMSTTEVTQEQWKKVIDYNPSIYKGDGRLPVEMVSYRDINKFVAELNRLEPGAGYTLPTEARWQYAAQAGTGQRYAFDEDELPDYGNCKGGNDGHDGTAPVALFKPNRWGLYDMHGNVSEWVADWYAEYPWEPRSDPGGPRTGTRRVRRGGSWNIIAKNCTATQRSHAEPDYSSNDVGFRLVRKPLS